MKKLVVMAALVMVSCAYAEEKSFWSSLFSSKDEPTTVEAAAAQDSQIAKLNKQIEALTERIEKAKESSSGEIDVLKKKCEDLKAQLKAKLEECKAKWNDEKSAATRRAEYEQTKTNAVNLIQSVKSLFE